MQINKVTYLEEFEENDSPAKVNRRTGHLFINLSRWRDIAPQHRVFILLHESAHCELDTSDEVAVDELAFKNFIAMGYPLTESLFALTRVLKGSSSQSQERMWAQYLRAKRLDDMVNKNLSDYEFFDELVTNPRFEIIGITNSFDGSYIDVDYYDYPDIATELGKVPTYSKKQQRKMKKSIRMYKKMGRARKKYSKADKVKAVANDIQAGADTRMVYAEKGMYVPTRAESISRGVGESIKGIASAIGGVMGGGGGTMEEELPEETQIPQSAQRKIMPVATPGEARTGKVSPGKNNTMLYMGLGVGAVGLLGITFFILKR